MDGAQIKGWATPEVWASLHPTFALAKSLERHDALLPIYWGLTANVMIRGRIAQSLPWAQEMLDIAEATGDADLLITVPRKWDIYRDQVTDNFRIISPKDFRVLTSAERGIVNRGGDGEHGGGGATLQISQKFERIRTPETIQGWEVLYGTRGPRSSTAGDR